MFKASTVKTGESLHGEEFDWRVFKDDNTEPVLVGKLSGFEVETEGSYPHERYGYEGSGYLKIEGAKQVLGTVKIGDTPEDAVVRFAEDLVALAEADFSPAAIIAGSGVEDIPDKCRNCTRMAATMINAYAADVKLDEDTLEGQYVRANFVYCDGLAVLENTCVLNTSLAIHIGAGLEKSKG